MKSKKIKKLSLQRETIRSLTGGQLDAVAGGTVTEPVPSRVSITVPTVSTISKYSFLSSIKD